MTCLSGSTGNYNGPRNPHLACHDNLPHSFPPESSHWLKPAVWTVQICYSAMLLGYGVLCECVDKESSNVYVVSDYWGIFSHWSHSFIDGVVVPHTTDFVLFVVTLNLLQRFLYVLSCKSSQFQTMTVSFIASLHLKQSCDFWPDMNPLIQTDQ